MVKLTKKMQEILKKADLVRGEINDIPWITMYGLEDRELVTSVWRTGSIAAGIITTTQGGAFPMFSRVKLTDAGLNAARAIQGIKDK
jgi:hypothetical protein